MSHVVDNRWIPIMMGSGRFLAMVNVLFWFKIGFSLGITLFSILYILLLFSVWFRDVSREGGFQGAHTFVVQGGLKWGLVWFLFREVWFFFRIFWSFFHISSSPLTRGIWGWPFVGLELIPPFQVPLLNTVILLISGLTATLAHQELLKGVKTHWILISMFLGFYFLLLQGVEYYAASFILSSGAFGRLFFFGTGFHGLHVCLGRVILAVRAIRIYRGIIRGTHHFRVEFSLWYWHFVDVVWLFLFSFVYAWGSFFFS